ncbi:MAG: hypothetical protein WBD31_02625, partial [Rubripirellula sp.]
MNSTIHENTSPYRRYTPPLQSGDVLGGSEYWRRYNASGKKVTAERINGKVYIMTPLRAIHHGNPHSLLSGWLFTYSMHDPNLILSDNSTIRLDADN